MFKLLPALDRRFLSTASGFTKKSPVAFAFDIDGVLMQSKNPILPHAPLTLSHLKFHKIPFVLLTNGGGQTEQARIDFLNGQLSENREIPLLDKAQLIQSHTPLKYLNKSKFKRVLIIGGEDPLARDVAISYGFEEVLRPIDIVRSLPNIWPFQQYSELTINHYSLPGQISKIDTDPIDAILVFNDPRDMGTDLQIVIDLLNSDNGLVNSRRSYYSEDPSIPLIWSNKDLLWSTGYPIPRFGQGAFRLCVRELYKTLNNGLELNDTVLGKPYEITYKFAESVLVNEWKKINGFEQVEEPQLDVKPDFKYFDKVYMVGDNPESDIKGGNDYGWETILVRTGVYKDGDFEKDGKLAQPTFGTFDNVWDGVSAALKGHGIK